MSNVIYFTTECNMRCEYCYEASSKNKLDKPIILSRETIREYVDSLVEKGEPTNLCLFGGEPLLEFENIKYTIEYCIEKYGNIFYHCLITNGLRLYNPEVYAYITDAVKNKNLKLEISFDGTGQYRRKLINGTSSEVLMVNMLEKLEQDQIPFWIAYTLHKGNFDYMVKDIIYLFEKYKYLKGISSSTNFNDLDTYFKFDEIAIDNYTKKIYLSLQYVYALYRKPICDYTCNLCRYCDIQSEKYHNYISEGKMITVPVTQNMGSFNQWQ